MADDIYRKVVEDQTELIARCGPDLIPTFVNQAYCRYFAEPREALIGTNFLSRVAPQFRDEVRARIAALSPEQPTSTDEVCVVQADGTQGWLQWVSRGIFDATGQLVELQSVGRDISHHKLLEQRIESIALGVSASTGEVFFSSLVEHLAKELGAEYVLVGELLAQSPEQIRSLALWAHGELVDNITYGLAGTPCENVVRRHMCSYSTGVQAAFPEDVMLVEMGVDGYIGTPLLDADGTVRGLLVAMYEAPVTTLQLAESTLQIFAARAAAELRRMRAEWASRQSEQRFRQLAENIQEVVWMFEVPSMQVLYVNPASTTLFGDAISGWDTAMDLLEFVHPEDREAVRKAAFCGPFEGFDIEYRIIDKDGEIRWLHDRGFPVPGAHGQVYRMAGLAEDITDRKRLAELVRQDRDYLRDQVRGQEFIGGNTGLRAVFELAAMVGPTDSSVLICGETGTGKELVARAIHECSTRRERTLITINCAAVSAGLVESELFGHLKGSFTGAHRRHIGRFELADGGTLFMDEVGELSLQTQAKLLRVLQEGEFKPVGGERTLRADVRLIAATNRDLQAAVAQGTFRQDLFYRLNVFPIELPPLRERKQDISDLVAHFLTKHARKGGGRVGSVSEAALARLQAYDWPGNVRELENVIERALVVESGSQLSAESILLPERNGREVRPGTLEEVARAHILRTVERTGWVIQGPVGAAVQLGLHPNTLRSRMQKLGIMRPG